MRSLYQLICVGARGGECSRIDSRTEMEGERVWGTRRRRQRAGYERVNQVGNVGV